MKVLIVEDEDLAADRLERILNKVDPSIEVMEKLDSVSATVKWLKQHEPELIFLDIHLSDGSGFSIFDQVTVPAPVIFTTAYDEYAIQAFKVNSVDYLLKPISKDELHQSLEKYKSLYQESKWSQEHIDQLLQNIQAQTSHYQKRLLVQVGQKLKSIPTHEMAYFEAKNKMVLLNTFDQQELPIDYSLDKLEQILDPAQFFRINRQLMINFTAIKQMHQYPKGRVKIDLHPPIQDIAIVSVERAKAFKHWLEQ